MKSFENKSVEITSPIGGSKKSTYAELLISCAQFHDTTKNLKMEENRRRVKVWDKVEEQKDEEFIKLEDAVHADAVEFIEAMNWGFVSREFAKFEDTVKEAKEEESSDDN